MLSEEKIRALEVDLCLLQRALDSLRDTHIWLESSNNLREASVAIEVARDHLHKASAYLRNEGRVL